MATQTTDLGGKVIYLRKADSHEPMPDDTDYEALVGDGKLIGVPNDVVVGRGSKWLHPRCEKYNYGVYGPANPKDPYGTGRTCEVRARAASGLVAGAMEHGA